MEDDGGWNSTPRNSIVEGVESVFKKMLISNDIRPKYHLTTHSSCVLYRNNNKQSTETCFAIFWAILWSFYGLFISSFSGHFMVILWSFQFTSPSPALEYRAVSWNSNYFQANRLMFFIGPIDFSSSLVPNVGLRMAILIPPGYGVLCVGRNPIMQGTSPPLQGPSITPLSAVCWMVSMHLLSALFWSSAPFPPSHYRRSIGNRLWSISQGYLTWSPSLGIVFHEQITGVFVKRKQHKIRNFFQKMNVGP